MFVPLKNYTASFSKAFLFNNRIDNLQPGMVNHGNSKDELFICRSFACKAELEDLRDYENKLHNFVVKS